MAKSSTKTKSRRRKKKGPATDDGPALPVGESRGRLIFVLRALALMALLYGLFFFPYSPESWAGQRLSDYLELQARGAGFLVGFFDPTVTVRGTVIRGAFAVEIVRACSSLDAQALFAAAVLAFPGPLRLKLVGVGFGLVVLNLLNLGRIAALYFVGWGAPQGFDTIHEEVMPLILVLVACGSFYLWTRWAQRLESTAHAAV